MKTCTNAVSQSILRVVVRQRKTAKGERQDTAATNDRGDAEQSACRKSPPAPAAAAAARSGVSCSRLQVSNASSTLSVNSSSGGLARLRRSNSIVRVAAEKKAKKVLSV